MGQAKQKLVMFPSKDPKDLDEMRCPECGFGIFAQCWRILFMPGIISPSGRDQANPIGPMYMCLNRECRKISKLSEMVKVKPDTGVAN